METTQPKGPTKQTNQRARGRRLIEPVKSAIVTRFCFSPAKPDITQLRFDFEIPTFGVTSVLLENVFNRLIALERKGPALEQSFLAGRPFLVAKRAA
jgi:hypothetical protein